MSREDGFWGELRIALDFQGKMPIL
jgi:hypothetical protein